jgi:hypothetical protein
MAKLEKINFHGWQNSYRLSNGKIELVVTTDVGPRVIFFGVAGGVNEFAEYADQLGKTGGDEWRIYGGHRLWHAPEKMPRTYYPDNSPVKLEEHGKLIRVIQPTEPTTGIQKEMDFEMSDDKAMVKITHRLINHNLWEVELAIWALSVMAQEVWGFILFRRAVRIPKTWNQKIRFRLGIFGYVRPALDMGKALYPLAPRS